MSHQRLPLRRNRPGRFITNSNCFLGNGSTFYMTDSLCSPFWTGNTPKPCPPFHCCDHTFKSPRNQTSYTLFTLSFRDIGIFFTSFKLINKTAVLFYILHHVMFLLSVVYMIFSILLQILINNHPRFHPQECRSLDVVSESRNQYYLILQSFLW